MTWTKLDEKFPTQPAVLRLSDAAFRLHITALCYCNQHTTDGLITADALFTLGIRNADPEALAAELVARGLWTVVEVDDDEEATWQLDWSNQEDAAVVQSRRKRATEKTARDRLRQEMHRAGDHRLCAAPRYCKHADPRNTQRVIRGGVVGDLPGDSGGDTHGSTPDTGPNRNRTGPDRPQGREGPGRGSGSARATPLPLAEEIPTPVPPHHVDPESDLPCTWCSEAPGDIDPGDAELAHTAHLYEPNPEDPTDESWCQRCSEGWLFHAHHYAQAWLLRHLDHPERQDVIEQLRDRGGWGPRDEDP